jgi:DNA repair photolyase
MVRAIVNQVQCKSAMNRVVGLPFMKWSLNPYRGCAHACEYCYARATHAYLGLDAGEQFSTILFAKVNLAEVLRHELSAPSWKRETLSIGTATDPYQPIEGAYQLTRAALEALIDFRSPAGVITKSTLVVRDADLFKELGRLTHVSVCISLPTVDEAIWRATEPGTPSPGQRLKALERLVAAGIDAGVALAPLLPGLSAGEEQVKATVQAARDHGARFLWSGLLHLDNGVRAHFLGFLRERFPELVDGYLKLYPGRNAREAYADRVTERVERHRTAAGLNEHSHRETQEVDESRQLVLL